MLQYKCQRKSNLLKLVPPYMAAGTESKTYNMQLAPSNMHNTTTALVNTLTNHTKSGLRENNQKEGEIRM